MGVDLVKNRLGFLPDLFQRFFRLLMLAAGNGDIIFLFPQDLAGLFQGVQPQPNLQGTFFPGVFQVILGLFRLFGKRLRMSRRRNRFSSA